MRFVIEIRFIKPKQKRKWIVVLYWKHEIFSCIWLPAYMVTCTALNRLAVL